MFIWPCKYMHLEKYELFLEQYYMPHKQYLPQSERIHLNFRIEFDPGIHISHAYHS